MMSELGQARQQLPQVAGRWTRCRCKELDCLGLTPLIWLLAFCLSQVASAELPGPSSRSTGLVITEIMYHPLSPAGRNLEFIELFNSSPYPEDISRFRLSGEISYAFPSNVVVAPGEYFVVAKAPADMVAFYGGSGAFTNRNPFGPFNGNLSDHGGAIRLRNRQDSIVLEVDYADSSPWPGTADGVGRSIVLARPSLGENNPAAWRASDRSGGSPGQPDLPSQVPLRSIVINEFLANSRVSELDFIELYNPARIDVDLSGCTLSDSPDTNKFTFVGATISAGSYLALDEHDILSQPERRDPRLHSLWSTGLGDQPGTGAGGRTRVLPLIPPHSICP